MRKKLEGNGLWESSRMMLPEHKYAINEWSASAKRRERVQLDEQEWEHVSRAVADSLRHRQPVAVQLYHPEELLTVIGVVDRVDQQKRTFMVDGEWFPIGDIEGASLLAE